MVVFGLVLMLNIAFSILAPVLIKFVIRILVFYNPQHPQLLHVE